MEPIYWMIAWFTPVLAAIGIWDAVRTSSSVWSAAERNRIVWVLINLVPIVGAVLYLLWINPELAEAQELIEDEATLRAP